MVAAPLVTAPTRPMRVVFLSHYFPPEVNAPAHRVYEMCREWASAGHEVHVVTCFPSHPRGVLYPGWRRRWSSSEVVDGIHVHRVWTVLGPNKGYLRRTVNYLSFVPTAAWRALRLGRCDALVATSPQFFCAAAGWLAAALRRQPFVFDLRDLWPDSIVALGAARPSLAIRVLEKAELALYARAASVVCVTRAFVENLASRGVDREKLAFVPNGVDLAFWARDADGQGWRARLRLKTGHVVASYVGTVGLAHGIATILDAAALVQARDPRVRFVIVGDGADRERIAAMTAARGLSNVLLTGQVPHDEVPAVLAGTDVSLVLLRKAALFRTVLPSKMFESMAAARPIVLGVDGEARAVLEAAGAGLAVPPEDAGALADAVCALAADPARRAALGRAGHAFVAREYDRRVWAGRYAQLLATVGGRVSMAAAPASHPGVG
jgi:colanic acid biosynthesis glycosyl transferase WcaI